mmetsp:Transcript_34830/g.109374  ORF Transcript_34830/g.109374 Transcript_34830/m.109374 type:complete len:200 (+) Transcript_34830:1964-2563(+)
MWARMVRANCSPVRMGMPWPVERYWRLFPVRRSFDQVRFSEARSSTRSFFRTFLPPLSCRCAEMRMRQSPRRSTSGCASSSPLPMLRSWHCWSWSGCSAPDRKTKSCSRYTMSLSEISRRSSLAAASGLLMIHLPTNEAVRFASRTATGSLLRSSRRGMHAWMGCGLPMLCSSRLCFFFTLVFSFSQVKYSGKPASLSG